MPKRYLAGENMNATEETPPQADGELIRRRIPKLGRRKRQGIRLNLGMNLPALVLAAAVLVLFAGCTIPERNNTNTTLEYNYSLIAKNFVLNDETYAFDAINGKLRLVSTTQIDFFKAGSNGWVYTFEFWSTYPGYGNRSYNMTMYARYMYMPTSHIAQITVINGKVTKAVLDEKWDMLNEEYMNAGRAGDFCGGIAPGAFPCAHGFVCVLKGDYPDAGGTCQPE